MNNEIKIILGEDISCNCRKIYPVEFYAKDFKNYSDICILLRILNKEKIIYLPYWIYDMYSIYSILVDNEKDKIKYPVEESDLILEGEDLIKIIDKLLDIIGFKKIIRDYVIVGIRAFHTRNDSKSFFYYFHILFDKPKLEKYERTDDLLNPKFLNDNYFVNENEFYVLRQFIPIYCRYILSLTSNNRTILNEFYALPSDSYYLIKDTIFKLIKIYSQDIFWHAEVKFEKYFSNEELLNEVDMKYSEKGRLKNKPSFLWEDMPWFAPSGIRFVFEKEYKNLDIKVKGFGREYLFKD